MERNKKTCLLFLLLALLHVGALENCPSVPDIMHTDLTCDSDYNRIINCVWNSTSDHPDNVCTIHAVYKGKYSSYRSSCDLKPVDASRPTLKNCSLIFERERTFQNFQKYFLNLSCNPGKESLITSFKPACHIKLNRPLKPDINLTTVTWFPEDIKNTFLSEYMTQLQWKEEDKSWSDPSVEKDEKACKCESSCTAELKTDPLILGKRYEARIRVKAFGEKYKSTWSDWSPTASWESAIGKPPPPPSSSDLAGILGIVAGAAAFAVFLVVIRFKTDKTIWVYMVKRIRGPPLPNPAKSFLQNSWLSPHFTSESFYPFFKPVEILSVEITSTVDVVAPCGPEAALLEKMRSESSHQSTSSNFSNPSYSRLCPPPPPPPVSSLTAGNLLPCAADTPYGPVGSQSEGNNAEQGRDEVRGKEEEIHQLLSKGSNSSEPLPVISDYEKVEKVQIERQRLQSLDSGMCSGEEVSQESLEADSITMTDEGEEEREGGTGKDIEKLFGGVCGRGSIQVCSGYERVEKLQADSPELPVLDSGISLSEEQVSQEDVDKSTESTSLLLPPPSALPCSMASFAPLPLNFSGPGLSPALLPVPSHLLALMSTNRSVEPSGDGYMPVRQEQS